MSFVDASGSREFTEEEDLGDEYDSQFAGGEYQDDGGPVTIEERAMAMGWHPLPADPRNPQPHEYRGDPRKWTTAEEFVARGEQELPILRDQNRRMSERLARVEPEIAGLRKTAVEQDAAIRHVTELAKRADQRGYDRAKSELIAQRRAAVEAGDVEGHDQVQEQLDALEESRAEVVLPPPPPPVEEAAPAPAGQQPEITQFVKDHPWFLRDERLKTAMIAQHNAVIAEEPEWPLQDQLDEALERMTKLFPEVAAQEGQPPMSPPPPPAPRRRAAPSLAPSGPTGPRRPAATSPIDRIADPKDRAEARAAYESVRRADPGFTEAEYMKIYEDPHIDAVELRRQRKTS